MMKKRIASIMLVRINSYIVGCKFMILSVWYWLIV